MATKNRIRQKIENRFKRIKHSALLKIDDMIINDDKYGSAFFVLRDLTKNYLKNVYEIKQYLDEIQLVNAKELSKILDSLPEILSPLINFDLFDTKTYDNLYLAQEKLSIQEKRVLYYTYILKLDTKKILDIMGIKEQTYKSHLRNINSKFGIDNTSSRQALHQLFEDRPELISNKLAIEILSYHPIKKSYKIY